jgi:nitroreductase
MRISRIALQAVATAVLVTSFAAAQAPATPENAEAKRIMLPKPQTDGGKPLMQALRDRKSSRAFSTQKLSEQTLSNLLWAACGINRPDGKRTAPSAMNRQETDVYVLLAEGTFVYEPKEHALRQISTADLRAQAGSQEFVKDAPLNLVYVADGSKMSGPESERALWYGAGTGFISENVYLFCASEGLATVVRGMVDRAALGPLLGLRPEQKITLSQTVGYPK